MKNQQPFPEQAEQRPVKKIKKSIIIIIILAIVIIAAGIFLYFIYPNYQATCELFGGEWANMGPQSGYQCIYRTSDSGNVCTDGSQCESGKCAASINTLPGQASGTCTGYKGAVQTGCYCRVENGMVGDDSCWCLD